MAILGSILKRTFELRERIPRIRKVNGYTQQAKVLKKLLTKAEFTAFGGHYNFSKIISEPDIINAFQNTIHTHDYNSMFKKWWFRALNGEAYVCWPGRIKYFALSSGTSDSSSKYIPVTSDMLKAIKKISIRQLGLQTRYDFPKEHFQRGALMLGGSTHLNYNGTYFEGDLSGITAKNIPFYFQHFYKPGKRISKERDWETKLEEITKNAKEWDIAIVAGVPAWVQILFERIITEYNVNNIHDIWPNLEIYVHGGVAIAPYKKGFEKLLGKPIIYFDTYLASEGFIAYQDRQGTESCRMVLDNGIFFEFVPFNEKNFDSEGTIVETPETYHIGQVQEGVEYALLLSTCSGAWRYLIGDVIKFTSVELYEIIITGRTKQFLSLCGEHLSQDNMNRAIELVSGELNIEIKEFTVAGINYESLFAHHWYIGTDDKVDVAILRKRIDEVLKDLNDDYRVERIAALKEVIIDVMPSHVFYDYMQSIGKIGASFKFPRVLKGTKLTDWETYLKDKVLLRNK
ncbi:MAG: GH3 auxin-responsive promoter family protein [Bacteroidia bacterium]|nr:GH3 auxin-responsive promoter family protein [Bacteroidia bacterium]